MFIHHFVSTDHDSPRDPAGKFIQALSKLIIEIDKPNSPVFASDAIRQFRELHARKHYPGLGYLKKLSMQHHFETLAHHLSN